MFQQFSPNMLKTFNICPKKFYFKYKKNISMPVDDEMFETGKRVHALASYYLKNQNISKLENALLPDERVYWQYLKNLCYMTYECLKAEGNLWTKFNSVYIGGRIDALMKKDDRYYILDYKTGSIPQNPAYDYQTMIYILAVRNFYKTNNISFVYIDLKRKKEFITEFTDNLEIEYTERLTNIINSINQEHYNPKTQCCPCEYKLICY